MSPLIPLTRPSEIPCLTCRRPHLEITDAGQRALLRFGLPVSVVNKIIESTRRAPYTATRRPRHLSPADIANIVRTVGPDAAAIIISEQQARIREHLRQQILDGADAASDVLAEVPEVSELLEAALSAGDSDIPDLLDQAQRLLAESSDEVRKQRARRKNRERQRRHREKLS